MSVLFPTDGNPIKPTLATPVLATSKPATNVHQHLLPVGKQFKLLHPPPPPLEVGVKSSRLSFASFAFS